MEGREMGNELDCTARFGKQSGKGKALLETNEILFRGAFRLKIPFSSIKSSKAADGELRIQTAEGLAVFELGPTAERWCEKILHPKSRLEKLGVKPGAAVSFIGAFEVEFLRELREQTSNISVGKVAGEMEWFFLAAGCCGDLASVPKLAKAMTGAAGLWIVYPKGQKQITENDVLAAGRKAGLKDVKVVGFSSTHTGLKFVIPVNQR
jgi:hypothetical protein